MDVVCMLDKNLWTQNEHNFLPPKNADRKNESSFSKCVFSSPLLIRGNMLSSHVLAGRGLPRLISEIRAIRGVCFMIDINGEGTADETFCRYLSVSYQR
jgi:hypothetical protein